jgi:hypothetical protein
MTVILFRPLDAGKWFLLGFNAFLALLAEGGFVTNNPYSSNGQGANFSYTYNSDKTMALMLHQFKDWVDWIKDLPGNSWLLVYIGAGILYVALWLVLNWVGCRGQFILLDNIVRNRAALAEPWRRYAHQGNVWFPVHIGLTVASSLVFLALGGGFVALNWSWIDEARFPIGAEVLKVTVYLLVFLTVWTIYTTIIYLIRSFVLPIYFKQTMGLGSAMLSVARLIVAHPVSVVCYLLISLLLMIAAAFLAIMVFCVACCVICWLAFVPFLGSMSLSFILCELILPLLIFLRCFQLDCLAQFGPEYDVWTVDVTPRTL